MVSYYNPLGMYHQKAGGPVPGQFPHHGSPTASWYGNYNGPMHQATAQQYLNCMQEGDQISSPWHHPHHPIPFHQGSSPDWTPSGEFGTSTTASLLQQQQLHQHFQGLSNPIDHDPLQIPSPPITVSGSELSSPGAPPGSSSPLQGTRPTPVRSPYEWMKKPSYQSQPNPGKTRTKDKYRVVYSDHQRLELEKEFHYSRYITIRRKAELAANLALSERQVKIWFQNRRAKERKQVKKREEITHKDKHDGGVAGLQLQHSVLHQQMVNSGVPSSLHALHHSQSIPGGPAQPPVHPHPSGLGPPIM